MKITKYFALLCAATVGFVACVPAENQEAPNVTGSITLTADKTEVALDDEKCEVHFTAEMKNAETGAIEDVTALVTLYDSNLDEVSNPFRPVASGIYNIMASYGAESSNTVTITVMGSLPQLPEDPDANNFAFNHRAVVIDHTAMGCGYCPMMTESLLLLEETEWHKHYNEVTCHAGNLAGGDPANSAAANALNQLQQPGTYPNVRINFNTAEVGNYGGQTTVNYITKELAKYIKKDGADAGISLAVTGDPTSIYCSAQVKANVAQEYKAIAWLLESNIYSPGQAGASKDYHKIYNYAIRNISNPKVDKNTVTGESIGVLEHGETKNLAYALPITSTKWNWENMGVLVIVSAKDANGRWEVVNSAYCKLNESKTYEYVE